MTDSASGSRAHSDASSVTAHGSAAARSAPSRATSSSFASRADSTSSWTSSAPSRAASADSSRLLVTITRHSGDAGSSGRTWATSAALSSSTSIRRPASTDR